MILQWKCFDSICESFQEPSVSLSTWRGFFYSPFTVDAPLCFILSEILFYFSEDSSVVSSSRSPLVSKQQSFFFKPFLYFHFLLWSTFTVKGCWMRSPGFWNELFHITFAILSKGFKYPIMSFRALQLPCQDIQRGIPKLSRFSVPGQPAGAHPSALCFPFTLQYHTSLELLKFSSNFSFKSH